MEKIKIGDKVTLKEPAPHEKGTIETVQRIIHAYVDLIVTDYRNLPTNVSKFMKVE